MAWYNNYRPKNFTQVIGQEVVKNVLQKSLQSGKIKHAYLFNGPKGVGKTTLARIFANNLNELEKNPDAVIDIVEIDAASNARIEDIRLIIDSAENPPLIGKYKIYIIDEVHMMSKPAMNALLKILEEPPIYLIFLLATTNPEKLIPTVLSRLTRLNLSNHSTEDLVTNLKKIAAEQNMVVETEVIEMIAKRADGSQRDAINLLETLYSFGLDKYEIIESSNLLGLLPDSLFASFVNEFKSNQTVSKEIINQIRSIGLDGESFLAQLLNFLLDESFGGNSSNRNLIQTVAKVLDLQLPATTILQAVSLIQAFWVGEVLELKEVIQQNNYKISPTVQPVIQTKEEIQPILTEENRNAEQAKPSNNIEPNISVQTLQSFFQKLGVHKELPPMLRMVIPDINVESIEFAKLTLSASSGIFLAQLNQPKIQTWLLDQIQKLEPNINKLIVIQRSNNAISVKPLETIIEDKIPIRTLEVDKKFNHPEQSGNKSDSKYFYEVYDELPVEMESGSLPVYKGEIKKPIKTKSWDDHASELFDFES